jgi:predicted nucleic acid-binding protein
MVLAVDSSTVIAYIQGQAGTDVDHLDASIANGELVLSPIVITEVLSEPRLPAEHSALIRALPTLPFHEGFWARAAESRAKILSRKLRARLADTLIAQSCIDHNIPLITRDSDFRHFANYCGLKLA